MSKAKSFDISKRMVWEAWKQVKAKRGAGGDDGQGIEEFEANAANNLYKLWNRMTSGSYMPKPVRKVLIPKSDGGKRELGIPTIEDRIAQTVAKMYLEPILEPHFHADSYGYRPKKSAKDAITVTRKRCWKYNWVIDLDIRKYFNSIDHELLMRAVKRHTSCTWLILYIERWLTAPVREEDGTLREVTQGTPQGGVISPLLANLFLHYAMDLWMKRNFPEVPFARFADDAVLHCKTESEAEQVRNALVRRFEECGLELHPEKTKIVYCKDDDRRGNYPKTSFDFLGFTFRPRRSRNRYGKHFINFSPAVSNRATKEMRGVMRDWKLHRRVDKTLQDIARMFNPVLRGWLNYYGAFYKSALYPTLNHLNVILARWVTDKYKKYRHHRRRAMHWLGRVARTFPNLFAHWNFGMRPATEQ